MLNHFDLLGVEQNTSSEALKKRFEYFSTVLSQPSSKLNKQDKKLAAQILSRINDSYAVLADIKLRKEHENSLSAQDDPYSPERLKPLFGHMCVAAGLITYESLIESVKEQATVNLAIGQILQNKGLITQTELDGVLMGQKLQDAPERPLGLGARLLLAHQLVDMDMIKIVLLDQRRSIDSLENLLVKRGWLSQALSDLLFGPSQVESPSTK
ncbi:MAG: J domain-containing protein [Candidatus Obscuribacterales bacterium]|nr:J domain-containing protein [Candidatus Obscuribacterales bacterium]